MVVYNNVLAGAAGQSGAAADFKIERSLRFNDADQSYLSSSISSHITTFTYSFWVKRCVSGNRDEILDTPSSTGFYLYFDNDGYIKINDNYSHLFTSNGAYRDPSAWMNVVVNNNGSTFNLYVNGVLDKTASITTKLYSGAITIGANHATDAPDYYLADVHFIDGQALAATDFGEFDATTGVWNPKAYSGTYGTNGFHLDFSDNSSDSALGNDAAGNNNFTVNNFSAGAAVPNKGYNVVLYTGTGASQTVGGLAFQPDLVWIKSRGSSADHELYDSVRGATKRLFPSLNNGESTNTNGLTGFTSNGFTLGGHGGTNGSGTDYVAWSWKAGGSTTTTNNDGNISSQVSVNTAYGFSIVKYTGNGSTSGSVGHGLGSTPKFVIVKNLSTGDWKVRHTSMGSTQMASLNEDYLANTASWNGETSSVFYPARSGDTYLNVNTEDYIAYCWSEVAGFSKFGSWTGTGVGGSSGPVITLGFKPRWVLMKRTDQSGDSWTIFDTARDSGVLNIGLYANTSDSELTFGNRSIEVSDTGFQVTSTGSSSNASGGTYIYAAFADGDSTGIDSLLDTPTNYAADSGNNGGNYATLNPLNTGSHAYLANGNLDLACGGGSYDRLAFSTIGMSSGKWYCEYDMGGGGATHGLSGPSLTQGRYVGQSSADQWGYYNGNGKLYNGGGSSNYGATYVAGDIIGIAFDADNGTLTFYKNGTSQGTAATGLTSGPYFFAFGEENYSGSINFGQRPFAYTPPTGFKSLCTQNLADSTIDDGSDYFDIKLYTGDGTSSRTISGYGFSPDLLWVKNRDNTAGDYSHRLSDAVRGAGVSLSANSSNAERDSSAQAGGGVETFTSDGFTIQQGTSNNNNQNNNNSTYVAWAWDAGSSNTSISAGSLNSSAYNQSQTWSSAVTSSTGFRSNEPATNGFDNSTSTICSAVGSGLITFAPTGTFPSSSAIRIYLQGSGSQTVTVNGGSGQTITGNAWQTVAFTNSSASSFTLTIQASGGTDSGFRALEIGGAVLVDNGTSVPSIPSIASTVRANPTAGFSIVTYSQGAAGSTVAHGLNKNPDMIIAKKRNGSDQPWVVYHSALGKGGVLQLHVTDANNTTYPTYWGNNEPNSNVFGVYTGSAPWANNSGNMVAYCFTSVEGYSKFGSYVSNNSTDGPFVFLGFQAKLIIWKNADAAHGWYMYDDERNPSNPMSKYLAVHNSDAEGDPGGVMDILSNGFKVRNTGSDMNTGSNTIVYMAWAEHPFKTARAR